MYSFVVVPFNQLNSILESEQEIFSQLQLTYNYVLDSSGDIMFNENGVPLKGSPNVPRPIKVSYWNLFQEANGLLNTVDGDIIDGYQDVFDLDKTLSRKKDIYILVLYQNNIYQGMVWFFYDNQYFGIYGIRTSILNTLTNVKGTSTKIIQEVLSMAKGKTVLVPWPLSPMIPLLLKLGFTEVNIKNNSERKFLSKVTGTSNYFIKSSS